jgi:multidrug efflux pump subunit AcrA (membrane-fusion protein)
MSAAVQAVHAVDVPWTRVLSLARNARQALDRTELGFVLMNDTHALLPYRQAALWVDGRVQALSGVLQPEANAPYVDWLGRLARWLVEQGAPDGPVPQAALPQALAAQWQEWWPPVGVWLRLQAADGTTTGGVLLAAESVWPAEAMAPLLEWRDIWWHAWQALAPRRPWWQGLRRVWQARAGQAWWRRPRVLLAVGLVLVLAVPVRLSVLAPGELVPVQPALVRAPLDGVVGEFLVEPNQLVQAGQPLFTFDQAGLKSRLDVARQALSTAEVEYRQAAQSALSDDKAKAQLAVLAGKIEERRADADYLHGQLARASVLAPQAGMVLFDDPSEWSGRPVSIGERIMRIADPTQTEVEAWLAVGDAIALAADAPVKLYFNADPLAPVAAQLRYLAHDAVQRPDGSYAYRVRARLLAPSTERIGAKGTAKLSGAWVPLAYWVLRRPWAVLRQVSGW